MTKRGQQRPVFLAQQSGLEFPVDGLIQHKEQGAPLDSIKNIKRAKNSEESKGLQSESLKTDSGAIPLAYPNKRAASSSVGRLLS
jgi:hypothetical protein